MIHTIDSNMVRERAAFWGSQVGYVAVEPFMVLREVSA